MGSWLTRKGSAWSLQGPMGIPGSLCLPAGATKSHLTPPTVFDWALLTSGSVSPFKRIKTKTNKLTLKQSKQQLYLQISQNLAGGMEGILRNTEQMLEVDIAGYR